MKIIFLGTNGWYTNSTGNTACILIDSEDHYVIFDAGNGIYKIDQYITEKKPIYLFISHFHLDHISGLHILSKFSFTQGIDVFVAKGRAKDFTTLVHPPYTTGSTPNPQNIANLKMEIRLHELSEGAHNIPLPLSVIELFHAYKDHGYRLGLENKTIAYSGDCGINQNSYKLAENADLLIHECSYKLLKPGDIWDHVDPTQAATLAKEANVKKLILTHFDPIQYPNTESRKDAEKKARAIFANTFVAYDDTVITL